MSISFIGFSIQPNPSLLTGFFAQRLFLYHPYCQKYVLQDRSPRPLLRCLSLMHAEKRKNIVTLYNK